MVFWTKYNVTRYMVSILYSVYFCACYLALILPRLCKLSHKKALALQVLFSVIMRAKSCKRFIKSIDFSPYMDIMLYVKQFYMRQIMSKGGSKIKNGRISVGKEVHSLDNLIGRYIEMCAYTDERLPVRTAGYWAISPAAATATFFSAISRGNSA